MAPAVSLVWDWANYLGYVALALCLLLFIYAGRPRTFPPFSGLFFANLHRHLGYLALLLVVAHVGLLLFAEPLLLEYLKPTAPLYMLAGLLASLLLIVLVLSSVTVLRKQIWPVYRRFKGLHAVLAIACVVLIGWHVAGSHYYLNTVPKIVLGISYCVGLMGYYLHHRFGRRPRSARTLRIRDTATYSPRVAYGAVLLLSLIALLQAVLGLPE